MDNRGYITRWDDWEPGAWYVLANRSRPIQALNGIRPGVPCQCVRAARVDHCVCLRHEGGPVREVWSFRNRFMVYPYPRPAAPVPVPPAAPAPPAHANAERPFSGPPHKRV